MAEGDAGPFAGLRVVEIAEGVAAPLAARLLADFGADVVKVEPPEGDRVRRLGPVRPGTASGAGGVFEYVNWNKRSVCLDLADPAGRDEALRLMRDADVVFESLPPGRLDALGLGYAAVAEQNPRLVMTSVTPFGQTGPYRDWKSDEIVEWAMGGYMYFGGDPNRPPLMIPGYQAQYHAAQAAAIATLAALRYRDRTGQGQHVDLSVQEATLSTHAWNSESWTHEGHVMRRLGSDLVPCRDGSVMVMKRMNEPNVFVLIERPELIGDPAYDDPATWRDPGSPVWQMFREWAAGQDMMSVYHRAQELRIALTPVQTMRDLLESEQLAHRRWFLDVETNELGRLTFPGFAYHFTAMQPAVRTPAPRLGEHTETVRRDGWQPPRAGVAATAGSQPRVGGGADGPRADAGGAAESDLPLAGLRVIEVTANWAGPLAGRHLGDLGAEVIKVEYAQRPATRALFYAGGDPGKYPYNRAGYFNNLNRNKKDLCLDLSHPEGKELFLRLVEQADIVLENNSARVMPNLGLGFDTLSARNPALVMVSVSGFGASGPEQHYVAYGANIEASCGLASVTGYGDGQPFRAGTFYADPVAANYAAIAILAALAHRDRTGQGQWVDMSLNEGGITFFGQHLLEYQLTGALPPHRGNRHPVYAPQGCYQTTGADAWLVLTVRDEVEWQALCRVLGRDDWAGDAGLASHDGRRARHDELDGGIAEWAARHDHREATRMLQAAGVPAAPVMANWELVSDPHLYHRDYYQPVEHREVGVYRFSGFPWKLTRTPARVRLPAPCFAEHNDDVLRGILGLSDAEVERLEREGVTAREPAGRQPVVRSV